MQQYWRFYWPLALTGVSLGLAGQFQNAALARYPDAVAELAIFALASGTFGMFHAGLNFTAQLSNVYARSAGGTRRSRQFTAIVGLLLGVLVETLANTESGRALIGRAYGIDRELVERVATYLTLMAPLLFVMGQRMFLSGLLVQSRLTGWVTLLNAAFLGTTLLGLITGFSLGWPAVYTLVGAQAAAGLVHWAGSAAVYRARYVAPAEPEYEDVSYRELMRFFFPVMVTGVMFASSRPVLYGFVSRAPDGPSTYGAKPA